MVYVVADVDSGAGFLVDATEVSRGQFAEYLRATNGGMAGIDPAPPTLCAARTVFAPGKSTECAFVDNGLELEPELPMSCVDWCTAWAFCRWSGKRLCGAQGTGAPVPLDRGDDVAVSEWYLACATGDGRRFPYGDAYEPGACATESSVTHGIGLTTCSAAETGPFDMSGNVAEWENGCSADRSQCAVRGGHYAASSTAVECGAKQALAPETFAASLGFRCCADATLGFPEVDGGEL